MTTSIKTDSLQVVRRIQQEAALGLLTCNANLRLSSLFPAQEVGATALSALTLGLCLVKTWSYKIPAVVTAGLLLYTIKALFDRIILRKLARTWRPIFENITAARYKEALQAISGLWEHASKQRVLRNDTDLKEFQFYLVHYRLSNHWIPFGLLYTAVQALNHVAHPPPKLPLKLKRHEIEELRKNIEGKDTARGHLWPDKLFALLETPPIDLLKNLLEPTRNQYSLLLYTMVRELRRTPESSLIGDHRASCFESDKLTFRYLNLLVTIGNQNVLPQDLTLIHNLLKCKTLRGLWEEVQKLPPPTIDEIEQRAFGYKMEDEK
jgi:hypothetical protein